MPTLTEVLNEQLVADQRRAIAAQVLARPQTVHLRGYTLHKPFDGDSIDRLNDILASAQTEHLTVHTLETDARVSIVLAPPRKALSHFATTREK